MYHASSPQDWQQVIFSKKENRSEASKTSKSYKLEDKIDAKLSDEIAGEILNYIGKQKAKEIVQKRMELGLSQKQLAQCVNIPEHDVKKMELGNIIKNNSYIKVIQYLNKRVSSK
jgi:ribosome-binding protein aMBF1 (putative translation factor)